MTSSHSLEIRHVSQWRTFKASSSRRKLLWKRENIYKKKKKKKKKKINIIKTHPSLQTSCLFSQQWRASLMKIQTLTLTLISCNSPQFSTPLPSSTSISPISSLATTTATLTNSPPPRRRRSPAWTVAVVVWQWTADLASWFHRSRRHPCKWFNWFEPLNSNSFELQLKGFFFLFVGFAEEAKMVRGRGRGRWGVGLHSEPNRSKRLWMMAISGGNMGKSPSRTARIRGKFKLAFWLIELCLFGLRLTNSKFRVDRIGDSSNLNRVHNSTGLSWGCRDVF